MPVDAFVDDPSARAGIPDSEEEEEDEEEQEDDAGEEDDDEEEEIDVLSLSCARCSTRLTNRAMQVFLVAEPTSSLFSTDIPSDGVREGAHRIIPTCSCDACDVHCHHCHKTCGYHVHHPCELCGQDNNGHYWLFNADAVSSERVGLFWSQLPYNGAPVHDPTPPAESDRSAYVSEVLTQDGQQQLADTEECCICAATPMWRPTVVPDCGHRFCYGCISREVDARGACPLDRRPVRRDQLVLE